MLASQLNDLLQKFGRVDGAGRVVGVDQYDGPGTTGDFLADVVDVRKPILCLVAPVVHRLAAGQGDGGRPQRIVGSRDQYLVAGIQQGLHGHHDQFADTVAQVDVVDIDLVDTPLLAVMHHRLAGGEQPLGLHVTLGLGHVVDDVLLDFLGHVQLECRRVTDVELEHAVPLFLQPARLPQNHPPDFVTDVIEFGGLVVVLHGSDSLGNEWTGRMIEARVILAEPARSTIGEI